MAPEDEPLRRAEHWQDYRTGQPKDLGFVWALSKGARRARCVLQGHPIGTEAVVLVDGEMMSSKVFKESKQLVDETAAWADAYRAKGWQDV